MAVKIQIRGVTAECDTTREAIELISALSGPVESGPHQTADDAPRAGPRPLANTVDFKTFWTMISQSSRDALTAIADVSPSTIEASKLAEMLEVPLDQIGWLRRKMKAMAANCKVNLDSLLRVDKVIVDGKPKTAYTGRPLLKSLIRNATTENGQA